jgi:calnexin
MPRACSLLLLAAVLCSCVLAQDAREPYDTPKPSGPVVFLETFNGDHWTSTWVPSTDPKYTGDWKVEESEYVRVSGDRGLVVGSVAKHHGIGALFPQELDTTGKDLIVQYEVQLQHGLDCGGAYIKLLTASPSLDIKAVNADYTYTIMFGPDKCGADNKLHFIIRHENPVSHEVEEKHLTPRPQIKTDKLTHLYTLHVRKDNTFDILIDQEVVKSGDLLKDFNPSINPPREINDPTDIKPSDWVDDEYIPDPDATKPDDWDENEPLRIADPEDTKPTDWVDDAPETIPDPAASKPADWDDEEDGEWVAPEIDNPVCVEHGCGEWEPRKIKNPKYKGKWERPTMKNPLYKGVWTPRQVPNPHFFEDLHPSNFPKMGGIAFELWTMTDGVLFDNILITHDRSVADDFAEKTWKVKYTVEKLKFEEENPSNPGGGFLATVTEYAELVYQAVLDNPYVAVGAVVAGILPIFVCSFITVPPRKTPTPKRPTTSDETKEETSQESSSSKKVEEEEIQPDEPVAKKSPVTRKRAKVPRADQ